MTSAGSGVLPPARPVERPAWVTVAGGPDVLDAIDGIDDLLDAVGAPVTARPLWLRCWASCFESWSPWAIATRDERSGRLDAVALLAWRRRWRAVDIVGMGQGPSDYLRLPARDAKAGARLADVVAGELSAINRPWRLHVEQLPADDAVGRLLCARLANAELAPGDGSPVIRFDVGRELTSYTSRNFRSQARRRRQQLDRAHGPVTVRFDRDPDRIEALLVRLEEIRRARDTETGRLGPLDTADGARFWWETIRAFASGGQLEVATLWAADDIAAYAVSLLDGPSYRSWDPRINPRWEQYSPGVALDLAVIERLLEDPSIAELDRMRGEEPYKLRTANAVVPASQLSAWSSGAARSAQRFVGAAKDRLRQVERLERGWRSLRRRAAGVERLEAPKEPSTERQSLPAASPPTKRP